MKLELLIPESEIINKVNEIAEDIDKFFNGEKIIVIGVLKGALFFMADLLRRLKTPILYDFIQVKSYELAKSTGKIKILKEPQVDVSDKRVLIIEDILDTGLTVSYLKDYFKERGAKEVYLCVLIVKKKVRVNAIEADFKCFEIDDNFVVGYGLDYDEQLRELKEIYILRQC